MNPLHLPRKAVQFLIRVYQKTFSLDHGPLSRFMKYPTCKYHPTCSEYAHRAIGKYGLFHGGIKSIWRILRCNPWSNGGVDEP